MKWREISAIILFITGIGIAENYGGQCLHDFNGWSSTVSITNVMLVFLGLAILGGSLFIREKVIENPHPRWHYFMVIASLGISFALMFVYMRSSHLPVISHYLGSSTYLSPDDRPLFFVFLLLPSYGLLIWGVISGGLAHKAWFRSLSALAILMALFPLFFSIITLAFFALIFYLIPLALLILIIRPIKLERPLWHYGLFVLAAQFSLSFIFAIVVRVIEKEAVFVERCMGSLFLGFAFLCPAVIAYLIINKLWQDKFGRYTLYGGAISCAVLPFASYFFVGLKGYTIGSILECMFIAILPFSFVLIAYLIGVHWAKLGWINAVVYAPIAFYHIILFFKLTSRWWSDAAFSSARFPDVLIAGGIGLTALVMAAGNFMAIPRSQISNEV